MQKGKNLNRPASGSTIKAEPIRKAADIEAIENLLANNPRNLALFVVGINTCLRVGELLEIKMDQVRELEFTDEIILRVEKGKGFREVLLNRACVEIIRHLIRTKLKNKDHSEYLFSGPKGPLKVPTINNLVKKWCAAVNLKGNYGGRTLRKTFGYHQLVRSKAGLAEIMVLFNHSSPMQTLDYLCLRPEELRRIEQAGTLTKPEQSYEDLLQKVRELENAVRRLRESELKFRTIFENVNDEIIYLDKNGTILEINDKCEDLFGLKREEVIGKKFFEFDYLDSENMNKLAERFRNVIEETSSHLGEMEVVRTDGARVFIEANASFIESGGEIKGSLAILRDVTERKKMEKELQAYRDHLEELVRERTSNLEEANAALRIMLRKESEVKEELEDKILTNLNEVVLPALQKVKKGVDDKYYLDFIESSLNNILSSFAHKLSSKYYRLTRTQIQIAALIKQGKITKQIAELLNLSTNTIYFHRANIRKKVGISKHKTNLRSFLLALD